jgi:hypothetical protein
MDRLIQVALQGKPVAWFSPSYRLLGDVWRELLSVLAPVISQKSEQEKRLELIGGGVIELWSLDSPDAGRSRKYAVVVIDEAAMVSALEQAWQQSIRPTLTDLKGSAWFLSTPKGMNYFKVLFDHGQDRQENDWASWQMPTHSNPFIDPLEIEAARRDITETSFNQEYLAQFVNWEGSVFRRVMEAATAVRTEPELSRDYIIGCDWGRTTDYTVFVVLDTQTHAMVALDRSNRVDYTVQCGRLRALSDRWRPKQILAEQNSIGQPILEQLARDGLRVQPFTTTHASKTQVIEGLALAFERGDIRILNDPVLIGELFAYQAEHSASGLLRYGAPSGQHDDCVMALAIAWSAICGQHQIIYSIPESEFAVEPFVVPADWKRAYGMNVGWHSTAVIWGACDPNTGVLYLYDEYYSQERDPALHVRAIKDRWSWIPGVLDPEGNGRQREDGLRMLQLYNREGLKLAAASNNLESGILEVYQRMSTGRLKVFASLERYREHLRSYRRDERGQIVTEGGPLAEAARCLVVSGLLWMRTEPVQRAPVDPWSGMWDRTPRGPLAWMG